MIVTRREFNISEKIDLINEILEDRMEACWGFNRQYQMRVYLEDIKKMPANQYVLAR